MKGKICFIVLSVVLAVSIGHTSDISAYTYRVQAQTALRNGSQTMIVTSNVQADRSQNIDRDLLQDASETVDWLIAEAMAEAEPVIVPNDIQGGAAEGTKEYAEDPSGEDYEDETAEPAEAAETEAVTVSAESSSEEAESADMKETDISADSEEPETQEAAEDASEDEASEEGSSIDEYEIDILRRIVMAEAGCEDMQGQIMVANVILNRIAAGFGNSISEVVFAPGQFSQIGRAHVLTPVTG